MDELHEKENHLWAIFNEEVKMLKELIRKYDTNSFSIIQNSQSEENLKESLTRYKQEIFEKIQEKKKKLSKIRIEFKKIIEIRRLIDIERNFDVNEKIFFLIVMIALDTKNISKVIERLRKLTKKELDDEITIRVKLFEEEKKLKKLQEECSDEEWNFVVKNKLLFDEQRISLDKDTEYEKFVFSLSEKFREQKEKVKEIKEIIHKLER